VTKRLENEHGVQLTGHLLEFYGLCDTCVDPSPGEAAGV